MEVDPCKKKHRSTTEKQDKENRIDIWNLYMYRRVHNSIHQFYGMQQENEKYLWIKSIMADCLELQRGQEN